MCCHRSTCIIMYGIFNFSQNLDVNIEAWYNVSAYVCISKLYLLVIINSFSMLVMINKITFIYIKKHSLRQKQSWFYQEIIDIREQNYCGMGNNWISGMLIRLFIPVLNKIYLGIPCTLYLKIIVQSDKNWKWQSVLYITSMHDSCICQN